jgi:TPR repeat protein
MTLGWIAERLQMGTKNAPGAFDVLGRTRKAETEKMKIVNTQTPFTMPTPKITFRMQLFLRTILILLTCGRAFSDYPKPDFIPAMAPDILSTNWLDEVRRAIPSASIRPESNFQAVTNMLCRESQRGNVAAQGLWGCFVLVHSHSPEEVATGLGLLRNSATNGFVPAMLNLGPLLQGGVYVEQDYAEAFHWFRKAAEQNSSEGLLRLGRCHHYGLGTKRDLATAAECYGRAAELTNYVAMKSLGYLLMNGMGVDKDIAGAKRWFTRAALEGHNSRAMYNLGVLACSTTNTMDEAFRWFKESAELGDPLASWQIANFHYRGWGVIQTNMGRYYFWRFKAATLGATIAQYMMGAAYRTGDGVPKNAENSLAWYRKAAAKNHPSALYDLALNYLEDKTNRLSRLQAESYMLQAAQAGHREAQFQCAMSSFRRDVGAPDCEAGKQWLAQAAENGWSKAEFYLFQLCYNGVQPSQACAAYPKDVPEAVKWLRRAAEHDNLQAQSVLAVMLIQGKDVERNRGDAERLLRNAAEHGHAPAQNDLGYAILNGDTSTTDLAEAAMWCRLAKSRATDSNVLRRVEVNLNNALSRLNADQRSEVEDRIKMFHLIPVAEPDPLVKGWETSPAYQQEDERSGH